ncbi:MAG: c-type cytochrome [Solirubrobacterales bacterium]
MSTRTIVIFSAVALVLGVLIPLWAINSEGAGNNVIGEDVTVTVADAAEQRAIFNENCGTCHALKAAGTDGVVGPSLDELLGGGQTEANRIRVLNAIDNGVAGRMPAGILRNERAERVADYVAQTAGQR